MTWFQKGQGGVFGNMSGTTASARKCLGYRRQSMCPVLTGTMMYIDSGFLGRPMCCRLIGDSRISVDMLLDAIDTRVPDKFHVCITN